MKTEPIGSLLDHPGPFLTAYLDVSRDTEDAAQRIDLEWRAVREQCLREGAPSDLVAAAGEHIRAQTSVPGRASRLVVAADDAVLVDDVVAGHATSGVCAWGPLPDLTRWLVDRDMLVSLLLVMADREGADLEFYPTWPGRPSVTEQVHGDTEHLTKVPQGDWAHKEYQRHTEEVWRRNAAEVTARIGDMMRHDPEIVALTGDAHAVGDVVDLLGAPARAKLVTLERGSRAPGSRDALRHEVDRIVHDVVVADHLRTAHRLKEALGRDAAGRDHDVASGTHDVLTRLVQGQVETLLVAPPTAAGRTVRPADYPGLPLPAAAAAHDELRADQVAVFAAAATRSDVTALGPSLLPDDGLAALLRWS